MVAPFDTDIVILGEDKQLDATEDGSRPHYVMVECADYITPYINSKKATEFKEYNTTSLTLLIEADEEQISNSESCTVKIRDGSDVTLHIRE